MGQEKTAAPERADEMLLRLAAVEELLRLQAEQNRKAARSRTVIAGLAALSAAVLAAGMLWLNLTLATATRELPRLAETTGAAMEQLKTTLEEIGTIDMEALNNTMTEVESTLEEMDMETLNQSIQDLQEVVEELQNFMDLFG